jgi:hypothetical protein
MCEVNTTTKQTLFLGSRSVKVPVADLGCFHPNGKDEKRGEEESEE